LQKDQTKDVGWINLVLESKLSTSVQQYARKNVKILIHQQQLPLLHKKERYRYAYYVVNNKVSQVVMYRFELEVSSIVKSYTIPKTIIHGPHDESQSTKKRSGVKIYMKSERK